MADAGGSGAVIDGADYQSMSAIPVQRWRTVYRRTDATQARPYRDDVEALEAAVRATDLPLALRDDRRQRARIEFGPPLPPGALANEELVDLYLVERWPAAKVRERLAAAFGDERELVELHDVWLRAPGLAASIVAADYLVTLSRSSSADAAALARLPEAIRSLLDARTLPRIRERDGRPTTYDLRVLIVDVSLASASSDGGQPPGLAMRLVVDPNLGNGRPDEVIAVLAELSGGSLVPNGPIVRGRIHLSPG